MAVSGVAVLVALAMLFSGGLVRQHAAPYTAESPPLGRAGPALLWFSLDLPSRGNPSESKGLHCRGHSVMAAAVELVRQGCVVDADGGRGGHRVAFQVCCSIKARIAQTIPARYSLRRNTMSSISFAVVIFGSTARSAAIWGSRRSFGLGVLAFCDGHVRLLWLRRLV